MVSSIKPILLSRGRSNIGYKIHDIISIKSFYAMELCDSITLVYFIYIDLKMEKVDGTYAQFVNGIRINGSLDKIKAINIPVFLRENKQHLDAVDKSGVFLGIKALLDAKCSGKMIV